MNNHTTAKNLLGKRVLDLSSGAFSGTVKKVLVQPLTFRMSGLEVQQAADALGDVMLPIEDVKSFGGDVIVVAVHPQSARITGQDLLNMPVLTETGDMIGRIKNIAFDDKGQIIELLLQDGYVAKTKGNHATLAGSDITRIGKEVIIVNKDITTLHFGDADEEMYAEQSRPHIGDAKSAHYDELFDSMSRKVSSSVNEIGSKIGNRMRQIDADTLNAEFNKFTDNMNREMGRLFDGLMEQFGTRTRDFSDSDVRAIVTDLNGNTVSKPINDKRGVVLLMPGQLINEEKIRLVIAADKVADLYRYAVPLDTFQGEDHHQS